MPTFYNYTESGQVYSFDDVFVPADPFRQGNLWLWGQNFNTSSASALGTNDAINRSTPVTTFAGGGNWKQMGGGLNHTAAIKTDGSLWTWGVSNGNQPLGVLDANISRCTPVTTFAGGNDWKQVFCGNQQSAGIKIDGTLWIWGRGGYGSLGDNTAATKLVPVTTFAGGNDWKSLATYSIGRFTAAIKTDGTLWTWGFNTSGQLGDNTIINRSTPVTTFAGGTNWKQVACGTDHTLAIKTDGTLWTWGFNTSGQLGDYSGINRSTPVTTFAGGTNWKQVAGGYRHTAAIKTDGTLWTWGVNTSGQLGRSTLIFTPVTTFAGGTTWSQVAGGGSHTAAIKTDGTLWTWGLNSSGQLGTNDINIRITPVTTFAGGTDWSQVSCGVNNHTAAIKTDGTLWTWGLNGYGQLGTNDSITRITPVTTFAGGTNWKQVACSSGSVGGFVIVIKTDGTLWGWGRNVSGGLGDNTTTTRLTPVTTFAGGTDWSQVSCGNAHTAAIKTDGTLWTYGQTAAGQLGINSTTQKITPVTTFAGGTNWSQVSCGFNQTAAVKTDGTLWTWGTNTSGQVGDNTIINRSTPVTTFAGGTTWSQVAGGTSHTAAIKTDGTLWTWGSNYNGQLGDNTIINRSTPVTTFAGGTNWKQVAGGASHTAAITDDGTNKILYGFGNTIALGINDVPSFYPGQVSGGGTNWKQVAGGTLHTAAIKTDGTLWTWGLNTSGQLATNDIIQRNTPVTTFAGGTNWKQVVCGFTHTMATTYIDDYQ